MYGRRYSSSFLKWWSFQSNSLYLKKWQCREHVFLLQLVLTINITPINIKLYILEKKIKLRVP